MHEIRGTNNGAGMLEIRRINDGEANAASKICTIAFNVRRDYTKETPKSEFESPSDWTWGAFEGGRLVSKIDELPYVMRFDGHDAKMSGIGGVATLPETRKGGKVRRLFEACLKDAYSGGVVFSCLAPFSHSFYRQFGYELCGVRRETRISLKKLHKLKHAGSFTQIFPNDCTDDLQILHSRYISDINHAIRRDARPDNIMWRNFIRNDPYNTGCFTYLWRDDGGEPRAYVQYRHIKFENKNGIYVDELIFDGKEAFFDVLSFIGGLSAAFTDMIWEAPMFVDPTDIAEVAWDVKQRIRPRDMTRIVNVKAALEMMRRPEGEGRYVIETEDPIVPENSGRFAVEYGPWGSAVSRTDGDADLSCDLPTLAQLVTGYRTLENLRLSSRSPIVVHKNEKTLNDAFTLRPQHLTEYF